MEHALKTIRPSRQYSGSGAFQVQGTAARQWHMDMTDPGLLDGAVQGHGHLPKTLQPHPRSDMLVPGLLIRLPLKFFGQGDLQHFVRRSSLGHLHVNGTGCSGVIALRAGFFKIFFFTVS